MEPNGRLSILQICSASQAIYGAVQSLMTLARAQRAAGDRVVFLTFEGKQFGSQVRAEGFHVQEVRVRAKIDLLAILQMRRSIKEGKFDIVHTHLSTSSVNGCLAARLARVPSVATVHGMSGKMSFSAATHLIAVSEEVKRHLQTQGVPEGKISVVHNGLAEEFQLGDRAVIREQLGLSDEELVVGTVSRVTALKGTEDGIRAVGCLKKEFPTIRYLVVGDGDGLERCNALVSELKLEENVRFLGYRQDVGSVLPAMDLFLFPTHKEAMGIALVEAMAAGLPCVATNVGGIPEVVTKDTGLLTPPSEPKALCEAASSILRSSALRTEMSQAAVHRCHQYFSASAMEQGTHEVYRSVLGTGHSARKVAESSPEDSVRARS